MRNNNRKNDEMREVKVTKNYIIHPEGSVLIEFGNTKVICNATVEEKIKEVKNEVYELTKKFPL